MLNARDRAAQDRLEALLDEAEALSGRLSFDEVRELAHLYRLNSARLAILRSHGNDPDAARYLNALCVRAYTHLQVPEQARASASSFFIRDLPRTLAATAWLQCLVAMVMGAGAVAGATLVSENPASLYALIPSAMYPADMLERLVNSAAERNQFLTHHQFTFGLKSIFSAALFVHNTQVGLLAFATGILAGVPTLLLAFFNGLTLGAFAWIFSRDPGWPLFWAWLLPHAIPELLAVTLCCTGGLLIGNAVVAPGRGGVAASLRASARPAMQLITAAVPLFVIAAGIESFLRQSSLSTGARFAAAGVAVACICAYAWYVRRTARRSGSAASLEWLLTGAPPAGSQGNGSVPGR